MGRVFPGLTDLPDAPLRKLAEQVDTTHHVKFQQNQRYTPNPFVPFPHKSGIHDDHDPNPPFRPVSPVKAREHILRRGHDAFYDMYHPFETYNDRLQLEIQKDKAKRIQAQPVRPSNPTMVSCQPSPSAAQISQLQCILAS